MQEEPGQCSHRNRPNSIYKGEMQYRMKTHQLPQSEVHALLNRSLTGSLSTIDSDGAPYSVPIHFVFLDGAIYFHGLPAGQKLDNLKADPRVCFSVYEMRAFLLDPDGKPCDTNTAYVSSVQWCGVGQSCLTYKRKNEGCCRQSLRNTHRSLQGGNCRLIW